MLKDNLGFESTQNVEKVDNIKEVERVSLSRTKRTMREYSLCNNFKYFVTFTISSSSCDRFSLQKCQDLFHKLCHNYQRRCKRANIVFKYLVITEKHDKGGYHFHGLVTDLLQDDLFTNSNGYLDSYYFSSNLGFFSASKIKSITRCANYIMKYITKDCVRNMYNRVYFCSKGLARAQVFDLVHEQSDVLFFNRLKSFENDYIKVADFSFEKLPKDLQLFLFNKSEISS